MRSCVTIACIALALAVGASRSAASGSQAVFAIPVHAASFSSSEEVRAKLALAADADVQRTGSSEVPLALAWAHLDGGDGGSGAGKKSYRPVLYSLILPGAGELALGYKYRGVALVAVEVTAWVGYAHYRNQGLDERATYEAFADEHWDHDRWIQDHLATEQMVFEGVATRPVTFEELDAYGRSTAWPTSQWPGYHTYHPKATEKQNYYENLGKYDWFISGWDDWNPAITNTARRDQYRAMRKESNDDLDDADKFIYLSIATRVYSLLETFFLVRSHNRAVETGAVDAPDRDRHYAFTARSTGVVSGEVALEIRF